MENSFKILIFYLVILKYFQFNFVVLKLQIIFFKIYFKYNLL